jgi:hypothetical protein
VWKQQLTLTEPFSQTQSHYFVLGGFGVLQVAPVNDLQNSGHLTLTFGARHETGHFQASPDRIWSFRPD